jgi:hypothetical protein
MMSFWVVPCRRARRALFVGDGDIKRQQPRSRRVDRHRRVHPSSGMPSNSARMSPRWPMGTPTLPTSPLRQRMIAVIAGLGRQIEGDRQAGLALGEIAAIERVPDPGLVAALMEWPA